MKPKIMNKSAFTVAGLKWRGKMGNNQEIPQVWERFMPHTNELPKLVNPSIFYGVMGNYDEQTHEFDYLAGQQVESSANLPAGMSSWELPAQTYAAFSTTLPKLAATFDEIYQKWLPASGYQHAPGPEFELYDQSFDPNNPDSEMFVYIPIVKQ